MPQQLRNGAASTLPIQQKRISYEEFLQTDLEDNHVEWVDGRIVPMAPVSNEHQGIRGFLFSLLQVYVEVHDLGVILDDPFQMKASPNLPGRAPDIQFISKRNLSRLKKNHLEGPADVVIEIVSPGSRSIDREDKYHEYEKGGVREFWLLDPERKQAEFFILGRDRTYRPAKLEQEHTFHSSVLKGLWIDVRWLWVRPRPSVIDILKRWNLV